MWVLTIWVWVKKLLLGKILKTNTFWFDGASSICREVKDGAFSWKALEVIYNLPSYSEGTNTNEKIAYFWNGLLNAKATRNRLKVTKRALEEIFRSRLNTGELKVLSIASGSARAVFETTAELLNDGADRSRIHILLLDLDSSALQYAQNLATQLGIVDLVTLVNDSTTNLEAAIGNFSPNVIEMVGFLEYRPYEKALKLLTRLYSILAEEGYLVVSQIAPNLEQYFLLVVINWPMVYRTRKEFEELLSDSGFDETTRRIIYEPLNIHGVAVCKKKKST
ncbi:MAG: class I SAM-dependent methyltransferase family protein [bacterium]|nr:class I SAM-dependent methyltransferase family protein [bacterium]